MSQEYALYGDEEREIWVSMFNAALQGLCAAAGGGFVGSSPYQSANNQTIVSRAAEMADLGMVEVQYKRTIQGSRADVYPGAKIKADIERHNAPTRTSGFSCGNGLSSPPAVSGCSGVTGHVGMTLREPMHNRMETLIEQERVYAMASKYPPHGFSGGYCIHCHGNHNDWTEPCEFDKPSKAVSMAQGGPYIGLSGISGYVPHGVKKPGYVEMPPGWTGPAEGGLRSDFKPPSGASGAKEDGIWVSGHASGYKPGYPHFSGCCTGNIGHSGSSWQAVPYNRYNTDPRVVSGTAGYSIFRPASNFAPGFNDGECLHCRGIGTESGCSNCGRKSEAEWECTIHRSPEVTKTIYAYNESSALALILPLVEVGEAVSVYKPGHDGYERTRGTGRTYKRMENGWKAL